MPVQPDRRPDQTSTLKEAESSPPPVSVVMPVHNAESYLDESIRSILDQTFKDFEFVILDDGSTDGSRAVLRSWAQKDQRIRLFESRRNLGLSGSSDYVVSKASAPLVARMDADDVSHPDRLQRQWEVMQKHTDVALVGTLYDGIDSRGQRVRPRDRWSLIRKPASHPFPHGSVMFRRRVFDEVGGYREACAGWEDLDLFLRMADKGRIIILPDVLYHYRYHLNCARLAFSQERAGRMADLVHRCLSEHRLGRDYTRLLEATEAGSSHRNMTARGLYLRGALRLWSGYSPAIIGSLLSSGSSVWDLSTLRILTWAAWGSFSPASLRLFLRCLVRARDWVAGRYVKDGRPYEWRFE